jgi:YHS domain-containing protein
MSFLFRFILAALILYLLIRWLWKKPPAGPSSPNSARSATAKIEEMKKDPECGIFIAESRAVILKKKGEILYFCSEECREKFRKSVP